MSVVDVNDPDRRAIQRRVDLSGPFERDEDAREGTPDPKSRRLDSPAGLALHTRLLDFYAQELERQADNRVEMALDEDYYDHIQWTEEERAELERRGQSAVVYNVTSTTLNWLIGTERRGRADYKILPRRKEQAPNAQAKTKLLKYLSDVNRTPFNTSRAFEDSVKVGVGWLEDGYQGNEEGEPVFSGWESWRNMLWDSASILPDLSDARFVCRAKWVDLDIAQAMFPERKQLLNESLQDSDRYLLSLYGDDAMDYAEHAREGLTPSGTWRPEQYERPRVRMIEMWFTVPSEGGRLIGRSDFRGEVFDGASPGHVEAIERGEAEISKSPFMRMQVAIFTVKGLVLWEDSPYRHNRYPFTPIWCYRRGRDNLPYGVMRGLRGMQDDINKRASKAQHILLTRGIVMDKGAVDDVERLADELHRPDFIIEKRPGREFSIESDRELFPGHLELMQLGIGLVQSSSGVTDDNLGRRTNASSGYAIERRQDQGGLTTTGIFDNLRLASQIRGEKQVSLCEQFVSEEKAFRITNMRGTPDYVKVNDPNDPTSDIVRSKADYVISEADWRATMRQAAADELIALAKELAPVAPQVVLVMLDLIVEQMDIENRDELVRRIRNLTGQRDPDATEMSPEEQARAQAQAEQAALQKQMIEAELRSKLATAFEKEVRAQAAAGKMVGDNVDAAQKALEAALSVVSAPAIVPVADEILRESGYEGRSEKEAKLAAIAAAAREQQQVPLQQQRLPAPVGTNGGQPT